MVKCTDVISMQIICTHALKRINFGVDFGPGAPEDGE